MDLGLSQKTLELLIQVFKAHPEIEYVKIFGSRAIKRFHPYSDIDLAVGGKDINELLLARIALELDELPLPYQFDVKHYETINYPPLIEHIDTFGKDIYTLR